MKVQVRKNILTFLYEVQTCENGKSVWTAVKTFKTREDAEKYAAKLKDKETAKKAKGKK